MYERMTPRFPIFFPIPKAGFRPAHLQWCCQAYETLTSATGLRRASPLHTLLHFSLRARPLFQTVVQDSPVFHRTKSANCF